MYKKIEIFITKVLMRLGNAPHHKGFHYLSAGIKYCLTNPKSVTNLSRLLYPKIAENFDTTPEAVECAIRNAIKNGWDFRDKELSEEIFSNLLQSKHDTPSNSLFISAVTEWIKNESEN